MSDGETPPPAEPFGTKTVPPGPAGPPDEASAGPVIQAEWALWGRDERLAAFHVLRCCQGTLHSGDFEEIFTRYATGVKEKLPQYTVYWIPAKAHRNPAYLAVGIHELADDNPALAGDRRRHVAGRIAEYIRLFCFRYADVAALGDASYAGLASAVRDVQLLSGQRAPIRVRLRSAGDLPAGDPPATGGPAELVASLLLTCRPVCVLDADGVSAAGRLAFIDDVLSLLPFGLRATLSASTWANPNAVDLKLRLFFSSARRDRGSRTWHVSWTRPERPSLPPGQFESADFYQDWLREANESTRRSLSGMKDATRFTPEDISQVITRLPRNKTLPDTFLELAASVQAGNQAAVSQALKPLKPYLKRPAEPADREPYRSLVERHQLLADNPDLHHSTAASLYTTLLKLAYGGSVSYPGYCGIEQAAGGKPGPRLQKILLASGTLLPLPLILAASAVPGYPATEVMAQLCQQGFGPGELLSAVEQQIATIEDRHRLTLGDFAVNYLCAYNAAGYRQELIKRGYLSGLITRAYPEDVQRSKLGEILLLVYGNGDPARKNGVGHKDVLRSRDIAEVFAHTRLRDAGPLKEVVAGLAGRKLRPFVEKAYAAQWRAQEGGGERGPGYRRYANAATGWTDRLPWPGRPGQGRPRGAGAPTLLLDPAGPSRAAPGPGPGDGDGDGDGLPHAWRPQSSAWNYKAIRELVVAVLVVVAVVFAIVHFLILPHILRHGTPAVPAATPPASATRPGGRGGAAEPANWLPQHPRHASPGQGRPDHA